MKPQMLRDIPLKYFLVIGLAISGLVPLLAGMLVTWSIMQHELKNQAFSQLESVRDIKKSILEEHFRKQGKDLPIYYIDLVMNERSAMGDTGETYLVGPDFRMRSDSYLDPQAHSVAASQSGTIEKNGADTEAVRRALSGVTGKDIIRDYRGRQVLSAYAPLKTGPDTSFAIIAEIDEIEIDNRIADALHTSMMIILGVSVALIILSILLISRIIQKNIGPVAGELGNLLDSVLKGNFSSRACPDRIGCDFREIVVHMNTLVDAYSTNTAEKKRLEQAVEYTKGVEAIGTLANGIAHDFNNILSYMHAYADLALGEVPENGKAAAHIDELIKGIDRASDLVAQITAFSRQKKKGAEELDLSAITEQTAHMLRNVLPRNITVICNAEKAVTLFADPVTIHQILINLCTNAFHAMQPDGGTLTLSLRTVPGSPGECEITVADTGCGMSDEVKEKMFEAFFTTKPRGQGSGIGLSVVKTGIDELGGTVSVSSEPGKGTAISIVFTRARRPDSGDK